MNYRDILNEAKYKWKDRHLQLGLLQGNREALEKQLHDYEVVREVFKKAAIELQNALAGHISKIVTKSIQSVFYEKDITFNVEFVERRNKTECDLYITEDGNTFDILDSRGHGMADLVSMALRVAYISLDNCDNVLIMDEPFRNLDKARQPYASKLIKELSSELEMQFIICTHIPDLIHYADNHIKVAIKDGVSYVG